MKPKNSLERVLAVLEVFSEERLEWTPEDLMRELGYSRPTLYRYLKILKDAGFLMSTRSAGVTLGPKVVEMDYLTRRSDPLVLLGAPYLKQLTVDHACTAMVLRWYGNRILCVVSESSIENPISSYPRGRPMPLGRGAIFAKRTSRPSPAPASRWRSPAACSPPAIPRRSTVSCAASRTRASMGLLAVTFPAGP